MSGYQDNLLNELIVDNFAGGGGASVLGLDKAIVERIDEMATRVIKLEGDDFREKVRKEKSDFAKKLGI